MIALYENTGVCGIALIILAFVSLYLFIKNSLYLRWVYRDFKLFFNRVEALEVKVTDNSQQKANPLIGIIQGVATSHATHSKDLRAEVAYLFHRHFKHVADSLTVLRLISVISPLLGLMGTVLGMVKVFRVIAVQTHADPAVMAEGIWEAMLTTIMGLTVAIPTLIFFYFLRLKMNGFQIESVEYGYRTLGIIHPDCPYGKKQKQRISFLREDSESSEDIALQAVEAN